MIILDLEEILDTTRRELIWGYMIEDNVGLPQSIQSRLRMSPPT